jgi:hypothetical protein
VIDVTALYCPRSEGEQGEDNTTHHLQPRMVNRERVQVCRYCGKTERQLREKEVDADTDE